MKTKVLACALSASSIIFSIPALATPIGAWEQVSVPLPDSLSAVQFEPGGIIRGSLVGSGTVTFALTTDGGSTWTTRPIAPGTAGADSLSVDSSNSGRMYATTYLGASSPLNGLYKSNDGGLTWTGPAAGLPSIGNSRQLSPVSVDPSNPNNLLVEAHFTNNANGNAAIFKSTDQGQTWSQLTTTGLDVARTDLYFRDGQSQDVFAGSSSGLLVSHDGGANWTTVSTTVGHVYDVQTAPFSENMKFAATAGGVLKSTDGGTNWAQFDVLSTPIASLAFFSGNPNLVLAGGTGEIFLSLDQGETWDFLLDMPDPNLQLSVFDLFVDEPVGILFSRDQFGRLFRANLDLSDPIFQSPAQVPEAPTLYLFIAGVVVLGWLRSRKFC